MATILCNVRAIILLRISEKMFWGIVNVTQYLPVEISFIEENDTGLHEFIDGIIGIPENIECMSVYLITKRGKRN